MNFCFIYWSRIINFIIQNYLNETTSCILWHDGLELQLQQFEAYSAIVNIDMSKLNNTFERNVIDFEKKMKELNKNSLNYDAMQLKLTMSIEVTHCENFIVFGNDIPKFIEAFSLASMYSIWRSLRNKFIFAYYADAIDETYFKYNFFKDQANILLIESSYSNATRFQLKTNKYVGSRAAKPEQMYLIDTYDAVNDIFTTGNTLFPYKIDNLQQREVIVTTLDYKPSSFLKYDVPPNVRDIGATDPSKTYAYIDGTEARMVMAFCEQYNCTLQIDTSDAYDWGSIYTNMTGDGAIGMVINNKAELAIGAMYYDWYEGYMYMDMSTYLVRSGITCLVPAPRPHASWLLPLQPFQATLWAAVLSCLLIETIGIVCTLKYEMYLLNVPKFSWLLSFGYGFTTTFKLFISQGGISQVSTMTARALLFACFLNDIIITSIYGGGLASILTIPSLEEAADTLERLHSHKLKWGGNSEAWVTAIRDANDPLFSDILKHFQVYTDEQLYDLAMNERMGFTVERLPFGHYAIEDYLTSEAIKKMKIMQDDIYFEYTVAYVPRIWSLLEPFNKLMTRWHSSGFDKYWEFRVVAENLNVKLQQQVESTINNNLDDIGPAKLNMSNFAGILLIWIIGIIAGILVFFGELLFAKIQLKRQSVLEI